MGRGAAGISDASAALRGGPRLLDEINALPASAQRDLAEQVTIQAERKAVSELAAAVCRNVIEPTVIELTPSFVRSGGCDIGLIRRANGSPVEAEDLIKLNAEIGPDTLDLVVAAMERDSDAAVHDGAELRIAEDGSVKLSAIPVYAD